MKSKEEIYRQAHSDAQFGAIDPDRYDLLAMDAYATEKAKEVIKELWENMQAPMLPVEDKTGFIHAINLIKQHFNIV